MSIINQEHFLDNSSYHSSPLTEDQEEEICILCQKNVSTKEFPKIVTKALYRKYCSNLNNYFYLKDIKRILGNKRYAIVSLLSQKYF